MSGWAEAGRIFREPTGVSMAAEIFESLNLIAKSKNLGPEVVVSTLQQSLINAAKKYLNLAKNIEAEIDKDTGEIHVYLRVNVVDDYPDVHAQVDVDFAGVLVEIHVYLRVNVVDDYPDVDPALTPEEVAAFDER